MPKILVFVKSLLERVAIARGGFFGGMDMVARFFLFGDDQATLASAVNSALENARAKPSCAPIFLPISRAF